MGRLRYPFHTATLISTFLQALAIAAEYTVQVQFAQDFNSPRFAAIMKYSGLPIVLAAKVKEYEHMSLKHGLPLRGPASAYCRLQPQRLAIAFNDGTINIINYITSDLLHSWHSLQTGIEQIEYTALSPLPEDERIISTAPVTSNVKIWDGKGTILYSLVSRYTGNPMMSHVFLLDTTLQERSQSLSKMNTLIRSGHYNPYRILREDCKHILTLSPSHIIAGFPTGELHHRSYSFRSPTMQWTNEIFNKQQIKRILSKKQVPKPVTALAALSHRMVAVGFSDGIVELWDVQCGQKKRWFAHKDENITAIKLFNKATCITTAGNVLKTWIMPSCKQELSLFCRAPILTVLCTDNLCSDNYCIICFKEDPLQVWDS